MHKTLISTLVLALAAVASPASAQQAIDPKWMQVDSASKRVTFDVIAGHTPFNGSLNFNGFKDGELTFTVPQGWTVVMNFVNRDGALPHSAEIIADHPPLPLRSEGPDIAGAATKASDQGTASGGGKDSFRFAATTAGSYIVFCGVAGHGMGGMWVRLNVDATAKMPSINATPAGK